MRCGRGAYTGLSVIFLLVFSHAASSQGIETINQVKNAYERHITKVPAADNPSVFLPVLLNDVREFGAETVGLNYLTDGRALLELHSIDLLTLQQDALKPFMDEICEKMQSRNPNLRELVQIYMHALEEEQLVTRQAYESIFANLGGTGSLALNSYMSSLARNGVIVRVDWAGIANDVPQYTYETFSRLCAPAISDEEIDAVINKILAN